MTYIVCAYDGDRRLVVTIQASQPYAGPGKPNSFNINLPQGETYNRVLAIAESVFGKPHIRKDGKTRLVVTNTKPVSTFLVNVAGLARTLDTKLDS